MPKFQIQQTQVCYVTWMYIVEAASEDEARDKFYQGDHGEPVGEVVIGDASEFHDSIESVSEIVEG